MVSPLTVANTVVFGGAATATDAASSRASAFINVFLPRWPRFRRRRGRPATRRWWSRRGAHRGGLDHFVRARRGEAQRDDVGDDARGLRRRARDVLERQHADAALCAGILHAKRKRTIVEQRLALAAHERCGRVENPS